MTTPEPDATPLGCLAILAFFLAAAFVPIVALETFGPLGGVVAAVVSCVTWLRWGPPPMPGLLPGLMSLHVLGTNVAVLVASVLRLV